MLKAVVSPSVSPDATGASGGLAGALRGGLEGLSGKLFAELLTKIATEAPPAPPPRRDGQDVDKPGECRKDKAEKSTRTDTASPANDDGQAAAEAAAQEEEDEDRARIRALLRRLCAQESPNVPATEGNGVGEGKGCGPKTPAGPETALDTAEGGESQTLATDEMAGPTDDEKALLRFLAEAHAHLEACKQNGEKAADAAPATTDETDTTSSEDATRLEELALALLQRLAHPDETPKAQGAGPGKDGLPETGEKPKDFALLPSRPQTGDETGGSKSADDDSLFADAPEDGLTLQATASGDPAQNKGSDDAMPETVRERLAAFLDALRQSNAPAEGPTNGPGGTPSPGFAESNAPRSLANALQAFARGGEEGSGAPPSATAAARGAAPSAPAPLMAETTTRPVGSYDFASQLSATRAARGGAAGLPPAVEQVALHLHRQAKEGTNEMTLQLRPVELGRIEIKLSFGADNAVQGTVVADSPATLDMLQKDQSSLQRALQEAGLRADSGCLQFSLRGDGQQQPGNPMAFSGGRAGPSLPFGGEAEGGESADVADVENWILTPGRVNLRV